ncbi:MAG: NYN domain-containing protein [Saprospiraceae bacterium]|nr:NYN domain-containing protein [Saprospiraceae bacterium]
MTSDERVIVYIDGFNLYFGMTESYSDIKWLNVELLAQNLLKPHQTLVAVYYFTSLVSNNPQKEKRQRDYISALKTTNTKIIYGHYKSKPKSCKSCGHSWRDNEEKMTDVNIAVNMVADAIDDLFDCAILISGDSDLVPPITLIHSKFSNKKVVVIFPPNRHNNSVKNVAKGSFILGKQKLNQSQFPDQIRLDNGFILQKPNEWK